MALWEFRFFVPATSEDALETLKDAVFKACYDGSEAASDTLGRPECRTDVYYVVDEQTGLKTRGERGTNKGELVLMELKVRAQNTCNTCQLICAMIKHEYGP